MARLNAIDEVAKKSSETAKTVVVKFIADTDLIDHPENHEDISRTADLEASIDENGFTTPLEVTDFGAPSGKYMIMSGHRRRMAGRKKGIKNFPCIVRSFDNAPAVKNYMLLANAQRDSDNDPLLRVNRYLMHREYLRSIRFSGDERAEIARRMGLSVPQADRYGRFAKIIAPVWDMVKAGRVGMSNVLQMASYTEKQQAEIYDMLCEAEGAGQELTRAFCENVLFAAYAAGARHFSEIGSANDVPEKPKLQDSGMPLNAFLNTEPREPREGGEVNRNNEVRREFDALAANADAMDADQKKHETQKAQSVEKPEKAEVSEEEKQRQNALKLMALVDKLSKVFDDMYTFDNDEQAELTLENMSSAVKVMVDEMFDIARDYDKQKLFDELLRDMEKKIKEYK